MRSYMIERSGIILIAALMVLSIGCAQSTSVGNDGVAGPQGTGGSSGSGGGGGIGGSSGSPGTPPAVSVADAHPVLDEKQANVHVVLSHSWSQDVTVQFDTQDGTAVGVPGGTGDYVPVSTQVTIPSGAVDAVVQIEVNTPYKTLTLETSLDKQFETKVSKPTGGATLGDDNGIVTLAQAGMVIETPLADKLFDGDIIPDFNGDKKADLVLTGSSGTAAMLLTPGTTFEEGAHILVDNAYLDGKQAFSWPVSTAYPSGFVTGRGFVASDHAQSWDANQDGIDDALIVGENKAYMLYGHNGPFQNFTSGDPRLTDGVNGTQLANIDFGYGASSIQTGDFDHDGYLDWAQAHFWSSVTPGSTDVFRGFYGSAGPWSGTYNTVATFSFVGGATPVGQSSLVEGTRSGVRADLNGDGMDDLVFGAIAANDGQFGGNYLYVVFGTQQQLSQSKGAVKGTLDGATGFQVDNPAYMSYKSDPAQGGFEVEDAGDVNGDGIQDLVLTHAGTPMTVIFGKKAPYSSGEYAHLQDMGSEAAYFNCDPVVSARTGDMNKDGIDDVVFITENKLRVLWGKKGLKGKDIFGTQYPEMGELDIDPASGLDRVIVVGDLDGDGTEDVVVTSSTWNSNHGAALVLFGRTLTRLLGGPDLGPPIPQ